MKRVLFAMVIFIFLAALIVPLEAEAQKGRQVQKVQKVQQVKKKKDRWEIELSYGQFNIVKQTWAKNLIFEKTYNPDIALSFRLRLWRGWYVGLTGGIKKELQNCYFTDEVYANYFWLENRFGNFLAKDYIERYITDFDYNFYIGLESKLNLFTLKLSRNVFITPYLKTGLKKWYAEAGGFVWTKDYTLYDLDRSGTIPYLFYHAEVHPIVVEWKMIGRETFWYVNPDGSKGNVAYDREWQAYITKIKKEPAFFYGGGVTLIVRKLVLSGDVQIEKMEEWEYYSPQLAMKSSLVGNFNYLFWRIGIGYRF